MKKLIIVAIVGTVTMAAILFSCSGDDAVTPASNLVSGVYMGDTIPINDTTILQVDLSVDEQADGTVNGGLWITWLYTTQRPHRERVLHNLTFTRMPDGQTVLFNGTASIDHPAGEVRISGNILSGSVIEDTVIFADGRVVAGRMNRRGPFLRPADSKSTLDSVSDNVGTYPALWGTYEPDPLGGGYICGQQLPLGKLVVTSSTINNVGTIDLEGEAYAWYSNCEWTLYQPGDTFSVVLPYEGDPTNFEIKPWETSIFFYLDAEDICNWFAAPFWNPSEQIMIINGEATCESGCMGTLGPKE